MNYVVTHTTLYKYSQQVEISQNEARLHPREFSQQTCVSCRIDISPEPVDNYERTDFFGNKVVYFAIEQPHRQLTVTARSEVTLFPKQNSLDIYNPLSWETVRAHLQDNTHAQNAEQLADYQNQVLELFDARQYLFDSLMITVTPELTNYAKPSFLPDRPLVEVVNDLMGRIYREFTYDPVFTTIATPLSEVLSFRRGVCQDFAHLAIGCLRAYGIAARYVSGYLETFTGAGNQRLIGADASHAWVSVYVPGSGWLDFDPTNNTLPSEQHITVAWGRDYADVTPLKGIAHGGGQHTMSVSVDVARVD